MESNIPVITRRLLPTEIGAFVRHKREQHAMKQSWLAAEARVSVRTLQRIEKGLTVSDDALEDVAAALALDRQTFTSEFTLPDVEAISERRKEIEKTHKLVSFRPLTSFRDLREIVGSHGYITDDSDLPEEPARLAGQLSHLIVDTGDAHDIIGHEAFLECCDTIFDIIHEIEEQGFVAKYAVYQTDDDFTLATITFQSAESAHLENGLAPRFFMKVRMTA